MRPRISIGSDISSHCLTSTCEGGPSGRSGRGVRQASTNVGIRLIMLAAAVESQTVLKQVYLGPAKLCCTNLAESNCTLWPIAACTGHKQH